MANTYADVVRLEGTWAGVTGITRSGQISMNTDVPRMILMKRAAGGWSHWTSDEDWDPGATGISYYNANYPSITNVQQALDTSLATSGYFVGLGVTGKPYYGDGIVDGYVTQVGSAVYSTDGHVYFMGEAGFTGVATVAGCKFVITPVPQGDKIAFVNGFTTASEYAYISFTGQGGTNATLNIVARSSGGNPGLLNLQSTGKVQLQTSSAGGGVDGIRLSGQDNNGINYAAAASSNWRPLYADADGEMVVGPSDMGARYTEAGYTGYSNSVTDNAYPYVNYVVHGKTVDLTVPGFTGWLESAAFSIQNTPTAIRPATEKRIPVFVLCNQYSGNAYIVKPGLARLTTAGVFNFAVAKDDATYGMMYDESFGTGDTGMVGLVTQHIHYDLY